MRFSSAPTRVARPGLRLVEGDVETVALEPFVRSGEPLFVIAEGLMMYLAADARHYLFAKVRHRRENARPRPHGSPAL